MVTEIHIFNRKIEEVQQHGAGRPRCLVMSW